MSLPLHTPALRRVVRLLVEGADGVVLDRILAEALGSLGAAPAVALWRRGPDGELRGGYEHGDVEKLPARDDVRAHLAHGLPLRDARAFEVAGDEVAFVVAFAALQDEGALEDALTLLEICARCADRDETLPGSAVPPALPARSDAPERALLHDLGNHLMGLRTTSDVLQALADELAEEEREAYGGVLARECRRAGELLADALGHGESDARGPGADLLGALRDVVAAERLRYEAEGGALVLRVEPEVERASFRLDELGLDRLVRNLLVNAREAASRDGQAPRARVDCALDKSGRGGLVLSVSDEGPGFAPEMRDRAFEPGASTKVEPGHGLGLASVRDVVARARGTVRVVQPPTGGTRFDLWIPGRDEAGAAA